MHEYMAQPGRLRRPLRGRWIEEERNSQDSQIAPV